VLRPRPFGYQPHKRTEFYERDKPSVLLNRKAATFRLNAKVLDAYPVKGSFQRNKMQSSRPTEPFTWAHCLKISQKRYYHYDEMHSY